ncbi:chaperone DNAK, putative [Babesia ovata]|uniref:Chaperone DNAK, putative n=1 Tax=Babesia ovata TaxID=189622 RepID=A0A2H6KDI4_9APIC|nr:chaperone DNAK, putative [Babesia ovata]GBE61060.1 chaperone DNAK, putative [Babesia ovata]
MQHASSRRSSIQSADAQPEHVVEHEVAGAVGEKLHDMRELHGRAVVQRDVAHGECDDSVVWRGLAVAGEDGVLGARVVQQLLHDLFATAVGGVLEGHHALLVVEVGEALPARGLER